MRLKLIPTFVFLAAVAAFVGAWWLFQRTEAGRYEATRQIAQSRSEIRLAMEVVHKTGPIASEAFRMADIDGVSSAEFTATSRSGTTVRVTAPPRKTKDPASDVAVLFGQAQQDGIWDLGDKPPRGDTSSAYTISVSQLEAGQHGEHRFTFTDPHYWATTAGQQYHIKLDRNKPVPDLVNLKSTAVAEPRYQQLVDDFRSFGSPQFRAAIAAQQAKLRAQG
jgi:hypothetical protein